MNNSRDNQQLISLHIHMIFRFFKFFLPALSSMHISFFFFLDEVVSH